MKNEIFHVSIQLPSDLVAFGDGEWIGKGMDSQRPDNLISQFLETQVNFYSIHKYLISPTAYCDHTKKD